MGSDSRRNGIESRATNQEDRDRALDLGEGDFVPFADFSGGRTEQHFVPVIVTPPSNSSEDNGLDNSFPMTNLKDKSTKSAGKSL